MSITNKQPRYYLQTSPEWKNIDYSAPGESTTIGAAGCGPTCAAMLIETLTGKTYTPVDACKWSLSHGYKALKQGTYYSYFKPQFAAFGIDCKQLNTASIYGNVNASVHAEAFSLLKQGYYLIACMGPGTWTTSGHFIVVWWEDGKVRINDPASTTDARTNGNIATFKSQVKYYWAIDARSYNNAPINVTTMTATGTVTATSLNVRSGPDTSYSALGSLKQGAAVTITGSSNGWYRIQYNGSTAWVSGEYVKIASQSTPTASVTPTTPSTPTTTSTTEEDDDMVRYNKLTDIPADCNFRNIVNDLMTAGIIGGDGSDPNGNGDVIDLSHDMVRMLIFEYRGGVYDNALQAVGLDPDRYK